MAQGESEEQGWHFGEFQVQPRRRLLLRGGIVIPLGSRALSILIALIERHGHLVTKDEIMNAVWPDSVVEEKNIWEHVKNLRKLLPPDTITTIPGRGYQFTAALTPPAGTAPVVPTASAPEPPAPRSGTNLPQRPDLIGRATELAELQDRLLRHRLLTLAGPGGVGKTRLAIELGRLAMLLFPDGVWLIDLAPLRDPALVASAAATVLGVALRGTEAPAAAIAATIGAQKMLLIFDNCEYLVAAAVDLVAALLDRAPGLSVLVTSQEILGIPAEQVYRVDPLSLPPKHRAAPAGAAKPITGFGAIDLFVERAEAADRRFRLDTGNAAAVVEICRRLDGMPLALEMAASRLPLLGLAGLRTALGDRLRLLGTRLRTAESRYRSLRAMVDWSHGLLDAAEQQVFRRLAIFPGSFALEGALAVAREEGEESWETVDALGRLIDKSLVTVEGGEPPRYRLLETLRLYAVERLAASGEREIIAERHARYFMAVFERAQDTWEERPDAEWLAPYRPEIGNVRVALDWVLADRARAPLAIALAGATAPLWYMLSLVEEGRRYIEPATNLIDQETPRASTARLLKHASRLWHDSDIPKALDLLQRSCAIYRELGDRFNLGPVLTKIGSLSAAIGCYDAAQAALHEAQELLNGSERNKALYGVAHDLGFLSLCLNEGQKAADYYTKALGFARSMKDLIREHQVLVNLAEVDFALGNTSRAIKHGCEAVNRARSRDLRFSLGRTLVNLASYMAVEGSMAEARPLAEESLLLVRTEGGYILRVCLELWALLGALDRRAREAAQLRGFVDAGYRSRGEIREPTEQRISDRLSIALEASLTPDEIADQAAEGARWTEAQAVDFAFARLIAPGIPAPISPDTRPG